MRNNGAKHKNRKKLEMKEALKKSLKEVDDRLDGLLREDDVIDIDRLDAYDDIMKSSMGKFDKMDIDEGKKKQATQGQRRKKQKKTKSNYLMNN